MYRVTAAPPVGGCHLIVTDPLPTSWLKIVGAAGALPEVLLEKG
jgi:hypothetical protein